MTSRRRLKIIEHRDARSWLMLLLALVPTTCLGIGSYVLFNSNQSSVTEAEYQLGAIESLRLVHEVSAIVDGIGVSAASSAIVTEGVVDHIEAERQNARFAVADASLALQGQSTMIDTFFADREVSAAAELRGSLSHIDALLRDFEPGAETPSDWNARLYVVSSSIADLWEGFSGADASHLGLSDTLILELIHYRSLLTHERIRGARVIGTADTPAAANMRSQLRLAGRDRAAAFAMAQETYDEIDHLRTIGVMDRDPSAQLSRALTSSNPVTSAYRDSWYLTGSEISATIGAGIESILVDLAADRRSVVAAAKQRRLLHGAWSMVLLGLTGLFFWVTRLEVAHRRSVESAHTTALAALEAKAEHDPLTGLWNRVRSEAQIPQLLKAPASGSVALIYLDLDRFKAVNDVWGHDVGDLVLVEVARRLEATVPAGFEVCRFGGDEFVIYGVLPDGSTERLADIGDVLVAAVSQPIAVGDTSIAIEATAGMTISTAMSTASELLLESDAALIATKGHRRGSAVTYDRMVRRDTALIRALPKAMANGELFCHFQPSYSMASNQCTGVEALVRWSLHDELISPGEFVPLAESFGMATQLTEAVLGSVADLQAEPSFPADCRVWMNISPIEMEATNFALTLVDTARSRGVRLDRFGIEITETAAIRDPENLAAQLRQLREAGIQIAIDDFGSGYSPLGYLCDLPFDVLKLDRSFVSHIDLRPDLQVIVRGIIGMMNEIGVEVVAEGVERTEEVAWVASAGAHVAQGFLYARPVTHDEVLSLVHCEAAPKPVESVGLALMIPKESLQLGSKIVA